MAGGRRTEAALDLLRGGLPDVLDYGKGGKDGNSQQFNERQPPTDTQARSTQGVGSSLPTYAKIGIAVVVLGLVVGFSVKR